ncbi:MAG: type II toxin-antitoxin system VapC family toxin [Bacteroidetes bacterium]|nr:MAG: type II toxin-antitoxin system VapC family toxin [Bacteroidota bacterium]
MKRYLLDTNICVFYLKGKFGLDAKIEQIGIENCFVSEITIAELKFGAEKSEFVERNRQTVTDFQSEIQIIPIAGSLDFYAKEKARLRKAGTIIDDFDLLIGATSIVNGLVMVTNNISHFSRIDTIEIEDWTITP